MTDRPTPVAVGPWETEYRAAAPSARVSADSADGAVVRLVGAYVVDPSAPPKDADPDRTWREASTVKVTEAHCKRCGTDLRGGVLQFLAAGTTQGCPCAGPTPTSPSPTARRRRKAVDMAVERPGDTPGWPWEPPWPSEAPGDDPSPDPELVDLKAAPSAPAGTTQAAEHQQC